MKNLSKKFKVVSKKEQNKIKGGSAEIIITETDLG